MSIKVIACSLQNVLESKSGSEANSYDGRNLGTSVTSGLYSYRPVGTRYYASGSPWRTYMGGSYFVWDLPDGALIQSVSVRYYVRGDYTTQNFVLEMFDWDWGTIWSTADWLNETELATIEGWTPSRLTADDNTSGVSVGWNNFVVNQTEMLAALQGSFDAGDTYYYYMLASNQHSNDVTMNTSEASVVTLDTSLYDTEFTITYVVPDNHTLNLGTVF